jgi:hypothetical protein
VWNTRITEVAGEILSYIRVRERTETDGVGWNASLISYSLPVPNFSFRDHK